MPFHSFALQSLCLLCIFLLLVVPVFIELTHFLKVCCLHLCSFLLEALHQLSPALSLKLALHLNQSLLDSLCLQVLAGLLAGFLVGEENFPAFMWSYMASSRFFSSMAGRETRLRLFSLPYIIQTN